ncbi:MAG: tRNA-dihydrouridine synthase family protein [Desulfobacterales bacterium]|jgi:tRNA-dihydrouridine synthase
MTNFQLYLAPLRGFTDYIYRNTFTGHFDGFDNALAPFVPTVTADRFKPSHLKDILPENNPTLPIVPQIIGNQAADFINLAERLFDLGYTSVNWNLGCPFPMVAKKHRGSGLLPYPERIDAFLEKTVSSIPNRLSIKTRLGRKTTNDIFKLMPVFNRYPLEEIIIHPRTGIQMYDGRTDLDTFERCLAQSVHRVIYNGDITDLKTFQDVFGRFEDIDGWMIGRGAVTNPFLPAIIKAGRDDISHKVEKFKQFYDELFDQYRQVFSGPGHLLNRMKGFWTYFSKSFQNSRKIAKKVHRTQKMHRYMELVDRFFAEEAQWKE